MKFRDILVEEARLAKLREVLGESAYEKTMRLKNERAGDSSYDQTVKDVMAAIEDYKKVLKKHDNI